MVAEAGGEPGAPRAARPFRPAVGVGYLQFLRRMHEHLAPEWYLEIGTAQGASLRHCKGNAVCVDPRFAIGATAISGRPQTHLFEMTSDAFFDGGFCPSFAGPFDLAFLDGLHLFEVLLRDFINAEKRMKPGGVIVLHDLVPPNYAAAERFWDRSRTKLWTGDVWKLAVILRRYRPDLTLRIANCAPTGLGIVTGLSPDSRILAEAYESIVADFDGMTIADYGAAKLYEELSPVSPRSAVFADVVGDLMR